MPAALGTKLNKSLELTDADLLSLSAKMVEDATHYKAMEKHSYTYFTERDEGERYVSLGTKGVKFTTVQGPIYTPATGLATSVLDVQAYRQIL